MSNSVLYQGLSESDLRERLTRAEKLLNDAYQTHTLNKDGRYPIEDYFREHGLVFGDTEWED